MQPSKPCAMFASVLLLTLTVLLAQAPAASLAWDAPSIADGVPLNTLDCSILYYWQPDWETAGSLDVGTAPPYPLDALPLVAGHMYTLAVTAMDMAGNDTSFS